MTLKIYPVILELVRQVAPLVPKLRSRIGTLVRLALARA